MARLRYAKEDQDEEVAALAAQIRKERGQMHNLYLMLLNSPPVARGWLGLLTAGASNANFRDGSASSPSYALHC
jgi:hypothetical protein